MEKLYGTDDSCVHGQLGQILDKTYKETKKSAILRSLKQKQWVRSKNRVLRMPSALNNTKGVGKTPRPPLGHPLDTLYPHPV